MTQGATWFGLASGGGLNEFAMDALSLTPFAEGEVVMTQDATWFGLASGGGLNEFAMDALSFNPFAEGEVVMTHGAHGSALPPAAG